MKKMSKLRMTQPCMQTREVEISSCNEKWENDGGGDETVVFRG